MRTCNNCLRRDECGYKERMPDGVFCTEGIWKKRGKKQGGNEFAMAEEEEDEE